MEDDREEGDVGSVDLEGIDDVSHFRQEAEAPAEVPVYETQEQFVAARPPHLRALAERMRGYENQAGGDTRVRKPVQRAAKMPDAVSASDKLPGSVTGAVDVASSIAPTTAGDLAVRIARRSAGGERRKTIMRGITSTDGYAVFESDTPPEGVASSNCNLYHVSDVDGTIHPVIELHEMVERGEEDDDDVYVFRMGKWVILGDDIVPVSGSDWVTVWIIRPPQELLQPYLRRLREKLSQRPPRMPRLR